MKKVLFLTTRLPFPVRDGRAFTLRQYFSELAGEYELHIVSLKYDPSFKCHDSNITFHNCLEDVPFFQKIINVFYLSLILHLPLQVSGVYSRKNLKKIKKILNEVKPDYFICDMIRTSRYVIKSKFKGIKILDMDDLLSRRYYQSIETNSDALGQFRQNVPRFFLKFFDFFSLNKVVLRIEAFLMKKNEIKAPKIFDSVVLVSSKEVEILRRASNYNNIFQWPVALNLVVTEPYKQFNKFDICFVGNLTVSQNIDTVEFIIDKIMPILDKKFSLFVAGKTNDILLTKYKENDRVKFVGSVENISQFFSSKLCLVAPIQFGSGIKIKVLEAMSNGLPVITSKIGIEGLQVHNEVDLFVCKTAEDYAQKIQELSRNENLRYNIAKSSIKYIKENHSYENNKHFIKHIFGD